MSPHPHAHRKAPQPQHPNRLPDPVTPIQYQWTLLEGIKDSDAELNGIARLLAGKFAVMNLIPYNSVEGFDYRRPSWERLSVSRPPACPDPEGSE